MLGTKEHHDLIDQFERQFKGCRLDRERDKSIWRMGHVYEDGHVNERYQAFIQGYAYGKAVWRQEFDAPAVAPDDWISELRSEEARRVATILSAHNRWRRGEGEDDGDLSRPPSPMPCTPQEIGAVIDRAVELLGGIQADKEAGNG